MNVLDAVQNIHVALQSTRQLNVDKAVVILRITHYALRITHYALRITHYALRITHYAPHIMADFFKPLSEYLKSSQHEWLSASKKETDSELRKQADYEEGVTCFEQGNYEEAVSYLKNASTSKTYRKEAYYLLAECYQRQHLTSLARKTYERLMRLDYNYRDVRSKIQELDTLETPYAPPPQPSIPTQVPTSLGDGAAFSHPTEDRYQILATIHEGRFARIYRVQDQLLERTIALKQVDRDYPERAGYLQQMKERAAVEHPNILRIYDIDEAQGQITMEYIQGRDLRHILQRQGTLALKMLIYLAVQLVNGLHAAHARGIVHYALLPEHVFITRQCTLKMISFRALGSFLRTQQPDEPHTSLYMPPELLRRKTLSVSSNIYSFGVMLYEMFAGRPPFSLSQLKQMGTPQTFRFGVGEPESSPDISRYDESSLPPGVRPILRGCLDPEPGQRYPTIREVGEDLVGWYRQHEKMETHDEDVASYKDYLMMALADGKISPDEATFLACKRQELAITEAEAQQIEREVTQELHTLFHS